MHVHYHYYYYYWRPGFETDNTPPSARFCPGDLRFEGVCLRYFPGGPLALRYVTFHIHNCEKVGIVGRTGSGKTTLLMGLFRLLDLAAGRVLVDGVDLAALPLREVRKRISIIPQVGGCSVVVLALADERVPGACA